MLFIVVILIISGLTKSAVVSYIDKTTHRVSAYFDGSLKELQTRQKRSDSDYSTGELSFKPYIYLADVNIGSQKITVSVDTGSEFLWVPSSTSDCSSCKKYGSFDPAGSENTDMGFTAAYSGSSLNAQGTIYIDSVSVAGSAAVKTLFGVAQETKSEHGILGLGRPQNESYSFTHSLKKAGAIQKAGYSLYLTGETSGSEIIFGAIDTAKYLGMQEKIPFWGSAHNIINASSVSVGSLNLAQDLPVVMDSGTSFSAWPRDVLEAFAKAWDEGSEWEPSKNTYRVTCAVNPTNYAKHVKIAFGSAVASIRLYDVLHAQDGNCYLNFQDSSALGTAILGGDLMKLFYTSVNFDDGYIGVAKANPNPGSPNISVM